VTPSTCVHPKSGMHSTRACACTPLSTYTHACVKEKSADDTKHMKTPKSWHAQHMRMRVYSPKTKIHACAKETSVGDIKHMRAPKSRHAQLSRMRVYFPNHKYPHVRLINKRR
jgi:hypothetical protein